MEPGAMISERRGLKRVNFGRGYTAKVMAIDGSWEPDCRIAAVADAAARRSSRGRIEDIARRESLPGLTPAGPAPRRCQRIWISGDELGVRFLKDSPGKLPRRLQYADPLRS